jgi:hypothetical protein
MKIDFNYIKITFYEHNNEKLILFLNNDLWFTTFNYRNDVMIVFTLQLTYMILKVQYKIKIASRFWLVLRVNIDVKCLKSLNSWFIE